MKRLRLVTIIICAVLLSECRNRTDEHTVPNTRVNIDIDLNLAQIQRSEFLLVAGFI